MSSVITDQSLLSSVPREGSFNRQVQRKRSPLVLSSHRYLSIA